jgi:predicted nucleotidyltransferase
MYFKALLQTKEYDFIRNNERLGERIMLLGLGGSYAYGTNNEGSDIDFRGVTLQMPSDLIVFTKSEQYVDDKTDTVIYGFNKFVKLLLECNPNTCEMLGLDEDQYLLMSDMGQELIDHSRLFPSRRAIKSFRGYADYRHFPLRDYTDLWGTMRKVVRSYDKIGKRSRKKDDNHLNKHAMHLIRMLRMGIDILEKGEIITHRKDDLQQLLAIRRGEYMKEDGTSSPEFYEMLEVSDVLKELFHFKWEFLMIHMAGFNQAPAFNKDYLLGPAWYLSSLILALAPFYFLCRRFGKTFSGVIAPYAW